MLLLAPVYAGCVFLFCYGYELYNVPKALRLAAIIVFFSAAVVIIVAVLCAILGESKSSSSDSSRSSNSGTGRGWASSGGGSYWGPIEVNAGGGTREVIREVPVPVGPAPIACAFCGSQYTPSEMVHSCPHCGAAQPGHPLPVET
jgi:hypothetical protein